MLSCTKVFKVARINPLYFKKISYLIIPCLWTILSELVIAQNLTQDQQRVQSEVLPSKSPTSQAQKADSYEFIAVVNEQPISKSFYELNLQEWLSQGQKDSEQLRKTLKEELINRELILQEIEKQGLDGEIYWPDQIRQLKQKIAVQLFTNRYLKEQGLTDKALNQDYQNQKKQAHQNIVPVQYKLNQITLREKSSALAVIGRLQQGESFDVVARALSANASSTKGSDLATGWVGSNQLGPDLAEAIAKLPMGGVVNAPIPVDGGWAIVQLEDKRSGKLLSYEEYKNQVVQSKLRDFYSQSLAQLRSKAKIHQ